jgi:hypothetical protein
MLNCHDSICKASSAITEYVQGEGDTAIKTETSQCLPRTGNWIEDSAVAISSAAVSLQAVQHETLQMFKQQRFFKTGNNTPSQVATS